VAKKRADKVRITRLEVRSKNKNQESRGKIKIEVRG